MQDTRAPVDLDETFIYQKYAYKRCGHCKAHARFQEIRHYSSLMGDGFIFCSACRQYVGVWDKLAKEIIRS